MVYPTFWARLTHRVLAALFLVPLATASSDCHSGERALKTGGGGKRDEEGRLRRHNNKGNSKQNKCLKELTWFVIVTNYWNYLRWCIAFAVFFDFQENPHQREITNPDETSRISDSNRKPKHPGCLNRYLQNHSYSKQKKNPKGVIREEF